jgi:hypothetical protein
MQERSNYCLVHFRVEGLFINVDGMELMAVLHHSRTFSGVNHPFVVLEFDSQGFLWRCLVLTGSGLFVTRCSLAQGFSWLKAFRDGSRCSLAQGFSWRSMLTGSRLFVAGLGVHWLKAFGDGFRCSLAQGFS